MSGSAQAPGTPQPVIRVHGPATPEEVVAVVTVLSALGAPPAPEPSTPPQRWNSPHRMLHEFRMPRPGPGAWAFSPR